MKLTRLSILLLALLSFSASAGEVEAKEGVIDLKSWDVEKNAILDLSGEWEIYWNQLIDPRSDTFGIPDGYHSGTSSWNKFEFQGKEVGGSGCATFRLNIINIPDVRINLMVRNVLSACRVFSNGILLTEVGTVGATAELSKPHFENRIVSLPEGESSMELVVQISNFHHRNGGFAHPFQIAKQEAMYTMQREEIMLDGMISSCYLFAGVFFLTLWIYRKKDKRLLYMALFCLAIFPRALTSGNYMVNTILPDLNWHVLVHIEYLSMLLPFAFILWFIKHRFPRQAPTKLMDILAWFMILQAVVVILTPPIIFSWIVIPHQFVSLFIFLLMLFVIFKAMKERESGALFGGTAVACLIAWAVLILMQYSNTIGDVPYIMTGLQIGFLLSMSLVMGARFSANFTKVEALQSTTEEQRAQLETQNYVVEAKNQEIVSSISYAKRIQDAILPANNKLTDVKAESFILYIPKDIVAGDFYWIEKHNDLLFFTAADCTGHGVPGAMVSVVCHTALSRSLLEFGLTDPGKILDKTREIVLETFETDSKDVKDGMDIALCCLDLKSNSLKFSGANNPLCVIPRNPSSLENYAYDRRIEFEDRTMYEFKGDKQPIGVHPKATPFKTVEIQLAAGDQIYLFSDGYPDQFGGEQSKKLMYKNFKHMLIQGSSSSATEQHDSLEASFENWKGEMDQTDDVCVIGVKI